MTRDQLKTRFQLNSIGATIGAVGASVGGSGQLLNAINHTSEHPLAISGVFATAVSLGTLVFSSLNAMRTSHRLAALELTGLNAEPEATRPQAEARGPRGWRPSHEG